MRPAPVSAQCRLGRHCGPHASPCAASLASRRQALRSSARSGDAGDLGDGRAGMPAHGVQHPRVGRPALVEAGPANAPPVAGPLEQVLRPHVRRVAVARRDHAERIAAGRDRPCDACGEHPDGSPFEGEPDHQPEGRHPSGGAAGKAGVPVRRVLAPLAEMLERPRPPQQTTAVRADLETLTQVAHRRRRMRDGSSAHGRPQQSGALAAKLPKRRPDRKCDIPAVGAG